MAFVPKLVAVDGIPVGAKPRRPVKTKPQPEVSRDVVETLQKLLAEARSGRVVAIAVACLDESYYIQPVAAGDAPASLMAEATRQLHELVARLSTEQSYLHGYRYFDQE